MGELSGVDIPGRLASPELTESLFEEKRRWHDAQARRPIREKFRILLEMQRLHLPMIARHRPLKPWERPWETEP